jgi:uncharacterized protein YuzE
MSLFNHIMVRGTPTSLEVDPSSHSVYVRFKSAKTQKTVADGRTGLVAIDLDYKGEVVGIELIHVKEFSIACIRHQLPDRFKDINLDRARFVVPHSKSEREPAFA